MINYYLFHKRGGREGGRDSDTKLETHVEFYNPRFNEIFRFTWETQIITAHLIRLKMTTTKKQTSRLVLPVFQEKENPSKIRSGTIGATIRSPKFVAHFLGPVLAPKTLAPLVCRKKIATPMY